jgi:hypothetical protein
MVAAIRQTVTVGPDGVIELRAPQLQPGVRAEVIILVESPAQAVGSQTAPRSLSSFIGAGRGSFASVEDVDNFIRSERDEWDR